MTGFHHLQAIFARLSLSRDDVRDPEVRSWQRWRDWDRVGAVTPPLSALFRTAKIRW